ncbi:polysaccharide deacetylase family protein [Nocardioides sp. LHG3406-4]|uniref:polysaccharide deacetylase family protein n=1 Tax=Nocardioides sp. LHG3406-4 TaxID=2804575 RepID=UPI003CF51234
MSARFAWPDGAKSGFAISLDFDAEEVWIGEDPANADRPGVLSQGTYGAKVAVGLILELLERRGITATFFVPGRVVERHRPQVEQIVAAGHELAHHGYTHTHPNRLTAEEESRDFTRAYDLLTGVGATVSGYRSPAFDFSPATLDIMAAHGIVYSSSLMDDLYPYRHPNGVVELPVQWILDDAPHFWFANSSWTKTIAPTSHVFEIWCEETAAIHDLGGLTMLALHPQIIGRPSRLVMLERYLEFVQSLEGIHIGTCAEIAALVP